MTKSIFSNLPNNLIMNIIKIAEDEKKKEEEKLKQKHRAKFINVIHQFLKVEEDLERLGYSPDERDNYDTYLIKDVMGSIWDINLYYKKEEEDYYDDYYNNPENSFYIEEDYNNPPENAYYWADELEPIWA